MTLFELTPLDPTATEWKRGGNPKVVQVRAATELDARHLAAAKFGIAATALNGRDAPCPWKNPSTVRAKVLEHVSYGPPQIVLPEN